MGKKGGQTSTGEKVENSMEFLDDGNGFEVSDVESDDGRRRSFRSSNKIIPEPDPEIQRFSDEIFGNFPKVEETKMEDENDEMGKPNHLVYPINPVLLLKLRKLKRLETFPKKMTRRNLEILN